MNDLIHANEKMKTLLQNYALPRRTRAGCVIREPDGDDRLGWQAAVRKQNATPTKHTIDEHLNHS